ncbi:hypothetical protein B0H10DRAFT_862010 [Mycena sp. CBHHK59/15]|nr:hypothetical protein B0H10DRAFT_862010 [Mycena sp. CBHHK59/15]
MGRGPSIELCEVRLEFDGAFMVLSAKPLPPLHQPGLGLTNLIFISAPPAPSEVTEPPSSSQKMGTMYLASSYLDFGDYTSTPTSELVLHSFTRVVEPNPSGGHESGPWICRHEATRSFTESGILESSGPLSRDKSKAKEIAIGVTRVFKLPDLSDHERWEPAYNVSD